MRAEIGKLVEVRGFGGWVYVTDAAWGPESIFIGNLTDYVRPAWIDFSPGIEVKLLNRRITCDDSLIVNQYEYPFRIID